MRTITGVLLAITLSSAACWAQAITKPPSQPASVNAIAKASIDATVSYLLQESHTVGATVAIVLDGKIVLLRGYGLRDISTQEPADANTRYEAGSLTCEFTNAAIVQLKDAGKIHLDDALATYIPNAPHAREITIRELLNDSSGLPPYLDAASLTTLTGSPATFQQLMTRIAAKPLDFAPGTFVAHSISNALILGRVVEVVSGERWSKYLAAHLFAPAGMTESSVISREPFLTHMARGYVYANGRIAQAPVIQESWAIGSGDVVTSAGDLAKWHLALDAGRIVSKEGLQLLEQSALLQGDTLGFDATDAFFPEQRLRAIVLTNTANNEVGDSTSEQIAQAIEASLLAASTSEGPSAQRFYSAAVAAMDRISQPPFVSYALRGESGNIHVGLQVIGHNVWLRFQSGSAPTEWDVNHRTEDYESEVRDLGAGTRYVSERPLFDPTWFGAFRALREGMLGYQNADAPRNGLRITAPAPPPNRALKTVASVRVIGPGIYAVQDRGAATCSNGHPGHAFHLVPRRYDQRRQLSDVIVDLHSMRFCTIRFGWAGARWFSGFVEQHYSNVDGYWIATDGVMDGTLRTLGIATHHFLWRYHLTNLSFPAQVPASAFVPDSTQ